MLQINSFRFVIFFLILLVLLFKSHSVSAIVCGTGKYVSNWQCKSCDCGQYCPDGDFKYDCGSGTYQPNSRQGGCLDCPAGYLCPSGSMCAAAACPAGQYQPYTRQTSCYNCGGGQTSIPPATSCTDCLAGTFCASASGCATCSKCAAGTYQANSKSTSCNACGPGTFSAAGATMCTLCAVGTFCQAGSCPNSCNNCAAGTFADKTGLSSCANCAIGSYSAPGASICTVCPKGTFCAAGACQNSCTPCAAGTYADTTGRSGCTNCAPGFFSAPGASICTACPKGTTCQLGACQNRCVNCARGYFANVTQMLSCFPCPIGSYVNVSGSDRCYKCDIRHGLWTTSVASTACSPHRPTMSASAGSPTESSSSDLSLSKSDTSGEKVRESPSHDTETKTFTLLITETETYETDKESFSKNHNSTSPTETKSEITLSWSDSRHHNSTTVSDTVVPTRSRSPDQTATGATATSGEINRVSQSLSKPSLSVTIDRTRSDSALTATNLHPSLTASESHSHAVTFETHSITSTRSYPTHEPTASQTKSIQHFPPPDPLGLSAAAQAAVQNSMSATSSVLSLAAAPSALTIERSLAILGLIGCDPNNPATGKPWDETKLDFPKSFFPGVGVGVASGFYYRGAILGFLTVLAVSFVVGFFVVAAVGKERINDVDLTDSDDEDDEKKKKENLKEQQKEEENSKNNDDDDHVLLSPTQKPKRIPAAAPFSFSSKFTGFAEKFKLSKVRAVPQIVFTVVSAILGMWSPAAGILFSTFLPLDICLALIPLVVVFGLHIFMVYRVAKSLSKCEKGQGLIYTNSMLLEGDRNAVHGRESLKTVKDRMEKETKKSKIKKQVEEEKKFIEKYSGPAASASSNNNNKSKEAKKTEKHKHRDDSKRKDKKNKKSNKETEDTTNKNESKKKESVIIVDRGDGDEPLLLPTQDNDAFTSFANSKRKPKSKTIMQKLTATTIRSFLLSPIGRFLILGDHFWTRPKGKDGQEARRILALLGNHMQKFRGPRSVVDFLTTANPFRISKKHGVARINIADIKELQDFEEREMPEVELLEEDKKSLALRIAPHYLFISWMESFLIGFLSGIARSRTETCPAIIKIMASVNIASFLLFVYLRPFIVPVRNYVTFVLELMVAFVSIIAAFVLAENSNVADGGVTPKVEWKNGIAQGIQVVVPVIASICAFILIFLQLARRVLLMKGKLSLVTHEELWAFQQYYVGEMLSEGMNAKKTEKEVNGDLMGRILLSDGESTSSSSSGSNSSSSDSDDENKKKKRLRRRRHRSGDEDMIDRYFAPSPKVGDNNDEDENLDEYFSGDDDAYSRKKGKKSKKNKDVKKKTKNNNDDDEKKVLSKKKSNAAKKIQDTKLDDEENSDLLALLPLSARRAMSTQNLKDETLKVGTKK